MNISQELCGTGIRAGAAFFVQHAATFLLPISVQLASALVVAAAIAPRCAHGQSYETTYDDDGMVKVNGERRFILGIYAPAARGEVTDFGAAMQECAAAGFNLVNVRGSDAEILAAAAVANGLMTWSDVGAPRSDQDIPAFRERVRRVASLPGIAFVESVDEPAWTLQKAEHRFSPEALIRGYPIIKELAPKRLVYTNHAPTNLVSTLQRYNDGTDIVAVDVYPVIPHGFVLSWAVFEDGLQGDLNNPYLSQVGEYVRKMRRVAGPGRPVFSVQQAFAWEMIEPLATRDADDILYPTHAELRFMAYQAIIEGATGIIYWGSHLTPRPSAHWDDLRRLVRELADMEGVLSARRVVLSPEIRYHEVGHSVDDGVSVMFKDAGDVRYAFTCNGDRYACRATLGGFGDWRRVSVLEESREIKLQNGTLTDDWEGFGVHVYRFER